MFAAVTLRCVAERIEEDDAKYLQTLPTKNTNKKCCRIKILWATQNAKKIYPQNVFVSETLMY